MKIELKNIHFSERLSEETNAFSASIYIDGVLAGQANNHGQGGPTDYYAVNERGKKLISDAEAYCKTLPPEKSTYDGQEFTHEMNLEAMIDKLLTDHLVQREEKKFQNKIDRAAVKMVVYGKPGDYYHALGFNLPIAALLKNVDGDKKLANLIAKEVLPKMKEGEIIFNTNIAERILKEAGLTAEKYLPFAKKTAKKLEKKKGKSI